MPQYPSPAHDRTPTGRSRRPGSRLSRRDALAIAAGGAAALLAAGNAGATTGPEETGLPATGPANGLGGVGPQGGAGAGGGTMPAGNALTGDTAAGGVAPVDEAMAPVTIDGRTYTAYTETFVKQGQWQLYTCEFDVAHSIMSTFDVETTLDDLVSIVGFDNPFDPYAEDGPDGPIIYGGDIGKAFCGDLSFNTFAKTRGTAMQRAFEAFGFRTERATTRKDVERGLAAGRLMWLKTTVDFTPWVPTRWVTPDGTTYPTVYDNDHCVLAQGFDDDVVVIGDCLGPTNTNWERPYRYDVPWDVFMDCWGSSGHDGIMVSPLS